MDLLSRLESSSLSRWLITLEILGSSKKEEIYKNKEGMGLLTRSFALAKKAPTPIMKNISVRVLLIDSLDSLLYPEVQCHIRGSISVLTPA